MADRDLDALASLYGDFTEAVRVDGDGGLWIVDHVDWPAFVAKEAAYTQRAGQAPTSFEPDPEATADEEDGPVVWQTWSDGWCNTTPSGAVRWALWGSESRTVVPPNSTLDPRERRTVRLYQHANFQTPGPEPRPLCSGVLIDPSHVLTAAHCVVNGWGYTLDGTINDLRVVNGGDGPYTNSSERNVEDVYIDGYPFNGNVRRDYAILRLSEPFTVGFMTLSNASNSTLETYPVMNTGYPAFVNGSTCTPGGGGVYNQTQVSADVTSHISGRGLVKTYVDSTGGQSGSPFYSCPAGDPNTCTGGQSGSVYGILSVIYGNPAEDVRGPRVPGQLRSWALGILP